MLPLQKRRYQRVWLKVGAVVVSSQAGSVMNSCGNCTSRPLWGSTWHRPLNCWQAQLVGWIWTHGIWAQYRCTSYKRESRSPPTFDVSTCLMHGVMGMPVTGMHDPECLSLRPINHVIYQFLRASISTFVPPQMHNHRVYLLEYGYDLKWQMTI